MHVIGLTGSIASGKSLLAARLAERGARVIDADAIGHEVIQKDGPAYAGVVGRFGPGVVSADGQIDRGRLGARVFADPAERRELDALVHPHLVAELERRVNEALAAGAPLVVVDAALIYELGLGDAFDAVIVVRAPESRQLEWLGQRGLSESAARQRIAAQLPVEEKARRAAFVVDNDGPPERLTDEAERLVAETGRLPARAGRFHMKRKDPK